MELKENKLETQSNLSIRAGIYITLPDQPWRKRISIKFPCENCGNEIVVTFLKPGEKAHCRNYGTHTTVPHGTVEVAGETKKSDAEGIGNVVFPVFLLLRDEIDKGVEGKEKMPEYLQ